MFLLVLPKEIKQLKFEIQLNFESSIVCVILSAKWKHPLSLDMC